MFVQFIEGRVSGAEALRSHLQRWHDEVASGAVGWLGSTAGVTDDGTGFVTARFESAEAARENSERSEQSDWWSETERAFEGPVTFLDCDEVMLLRGGGSDDAGFVQVIRGQVSDPDAARDLMLTGMPDDARPDVLGGIVGMQPDGTYVMVVYFTSEDAARAAEAGDTDVEFDEQMAALHREPPRYLDLPDPWFWSP